MTKIFQKNKKDEISTVIRFLRNDKINFQLTKQNFDVYPEEPADICVKDINEKFQVTWGDHEFMEKMGKNKNKNSVAEIGPRRINDVIREYFNKPRTKKKDYTGATDIILLIRAPLDPPWVETISTSKSYTKINSNFKEIYLVCDDKNILIYRKHCE